MSTGYIHIHICGSCRYIEHEHYSYYCIMFVFYLQLPQSYMFFVHNVYMYNVEAMCLPRLPVWPHPQPPRPSSGVPSPTSPSPVQQLHPLSHDHFLKTDQTHDEGRSCGWSKLWPPVTVFVAWPVLRGAVPSKASQLFPVHSQLGAVAIYMVYIVQCVCVCVCGKG